MGSRYLYWILTGHSFAVHQSQDFRHAVFFFAKISGIVHSLNVVDYCKMCRNCCIGEMCSVCPGIFDDIKG